MGNPEAESLAASDPCVRHAAEPDQSPVFRVDPDAGDPESGTGNSGAASGGRTGRTEKGTGTAKRKRSGEPRQNGAGY